MNQTLHTRNTTFVFSLAAVLTIMLASCTMSDKKGISSTEWVLTEKQVVTGEPPTLMFNENDLSVSGYDGCNRFFGTYEVVSKHLIAINTLGSTKMLCPNNPSSDAFLASLTPNMRYQLNDNELILITEGGKTLTFVGKAP